MLKKIFSNTLAQLVAKFFGAGLTLLTTYYTIRLAGLDLYGDLTKILVLVAVGFTAIDFGLNAEGLRSSHSDDLMKKNTQSIILARLVLSFLVIIILNLIIHFLSGGYSQQVKSTFWLGSLAIIFQGIYTSSNAWFQYRLSYWRATLAVIVGALVCTLLTFYYLRFSPSLHSFVLANTLGYLAMAVTSILLLPRFELKSWNLKTITPLLKNSLILGFILIANVIAIKIDTVLLGIFKSSSEVGQYGFAYRIFEVLLVLPVFVINAIYPLSLKEPTQNFKSSLFDKTVKYLAVISVLVAAVTWWLAPYLNLVKSGITQSISVLRILAFTIPLFYITAPLMWSLIRQKRDKIVLMVYVLAAILNLVLNLSLIPSYGAIAAAINTGLTELFIFLALYYFTALPFKSQS